MSICLGRKEGINLKQCIQIRTCSCLNISFNTLKPMVVGRGGKTEQLQPSRLTRTEEEYHMQPISLSIQWITQASFTRKSLLKFIWIVWKQLKKNLQIFSTYMSCITSPPPRLVYDFQLGVVFLTVTGRTWLHFIWFARLD